MVSSASPPSAFLLPLPGSGQSLTCGARHPGSSERLFQSASHSAVPAFLALVNVQFLAFSSMWAHCMPRTFLPAPTLPICLLTGQQGPSCLGQALSERRRAWPRVPRAWPAVSAATHSPGDGELLYPCCLWVLACLVGSGEVLVF